MPGTEARRSMSLRPLRDKKSRESEPGASEVDEPKKPSGTSRGAISSISPEEEKALLSLVRERLSDAERATHDLYPQWAVALAYDAGNQWVIWDAEAGALRDMRDNNDREWYRTANIMRPLLARGTSRLTSNRPASQIIPRTQRDLDRQAATELRVVEDHYEAKHDGRMQLRRMVHYGLLCTTAFLLQYWDPEAMAEVPVEWDSFGEPTRYEPRPVGDLCERVVWGHQVKLDPRADVFETCQWAALDMLLPNGEIERRYGIAPSAPSGLAGRVMNSLGSFGRWVIGPNANPIRNEEAPRQARVVVLYDKPTARYLKGRVIHALPDEDKILKVEPELPMGIIPLIPLGNQTQAGTPYHRGVGFDAAQVQYDYNVLRSRWAGMLRDQKITLTRENTDGAGADLVDDLIEEGPRYRTIWHDRGAAAPNFNVTPVPDAGLLNALEKFERELQNMCGVHDASMGIASADAKSGYQVKLLQDADNSMMATFVQAIEQFVIERTRRRGLFAARYVKEPRAWGLDDKNNPEESDAVTSSNLPALTAGGMAVVRISEGSGTPRTPEAMDAEIMGLFQSGALGDPTTPEAQEALLSALYSPAAARAKEIVEKIRERKEREALLASQLDNETAAPGAEGAEMPAEMPLGATNAEMPIEAAPDMSAPEMALQEL
jgi:hypothetical protein